MASKTKSLIQERIQNANYNLKGTATISLNDVDINEIQNALDEIKTSSEYSSLDMDYNPQDHTLKIIDPSENIEGFENTHPSRKPCN